MGRSNHPGIPAGFPGMVHRTLTFISGPDATGGPAGLDDRLFPTHAAVISRRTVAYRSLYLVLAALFAGKIGGYFGMNHPGRRLVAHHTDSDPNLGKGFFLEGDGNADLLTVDHRIDMAGADAFHRDDVGAVHVRDGLFHRRPDPVKASAVIGFEHAVDIQVGTGTGAYHGAPDYGGGATGQQKDADEKQ